MKHLVNKSIFMFFLTLAFTSLVSAGFANDCDLNQRVSYHELDQNISENDSVKVYLSPDQVWISTKGIFVHFEGIASPLLVESLLCDNVGIYTYLMARNPKCGHARACNRCNGCSPGNTCQYRCKCNQPFLVE